MLKQQLFDQGWCRFDADPLVKDWIANALPAARAAIADPENAQWLRCGGTWHAGVNILPNDTSGAVDDGPVLQGAAIDFIANDLGMKDVSWDRAQVSVCYPGYPKPMAGETDTAFRFRRDRDAAHVDGLHREGQDNRRHLREYHRFILGIPLVEFSQGASPLALWRGSHKVARRVFQREFGGISPATWGAHDVTELYRAMRKEVFETCERVIISARPGECYLLHRLTLHGASPWQEGAEAGPDGRMIAYFRPDFSKAEEWLSLP